MDSITLLSPAKINLCLSVLGKRPDGYHDVAMVMQMVGLYDEVVVSRQPRGITITCDNAAVPADSGNVAWKAADLVLEAAGKKDSAGLAVNIKKHIPVAAGLAGGSGNAAAVLVGANTVLSSGFSKKQLAELGTRIGMDVPFFFSGPTAVAQGRGELVTPVAPCPKCWVLLVNPGFATSTAWVYKNVNLRLTKKVDCTNIARLNTGNIAESLHNDLETVTSAAHPEINRIKDALVRRGAQGALMSGSGPTVFGIFASESACRAAASGLAGSGWLLYPAETLTESPFSAYLS
jgi:4-diphosphocytidyl-2-C-methyl-D-erythritol kinase